MSHKDYPNLIPKEKSVLTIATSAVMAVYNWPSDARRYKKVKKFISVFFNNIQKFSTSSRHPKWKEVSLTARVPGWTRFKAADDIVSALSGSNNASKTEKKFQDFLKQQNLGQKNLPAQQVKELFKAFMKWSKSQ